MMEEDPFEVQRHCNLRKCQGLQKLCPYTTWTKSKNMSRELGTGSVCSKPLNINSYGSFPSFHL
jgi:hypothetical protein